MKLTKILKKHSPTILTCIGSIGVVVTAVLTTKSTIKAVRIYDSIKQNESSTSEIVKAIFPNYIPSMIAATVSIISIFGANALNIKRQAVIMSSYILLDRMYKEYKNKVKEVLGEESERRVQESIAEELIKKENITPVGENLIFYEPYYGQCFQRTMLEVQDAEYKLNQKFATEGEASLNDFFELLGLSKTDTGDSIGWSQENSYDFYNYTWIEFEHQLTRGCDGMEYYTINMPFPPTFGFSVPL